MPERDRAASGAHTSNPGPERYKAQLSHGAIEEAGLAAGFGSWSLEPTLGFTESFNPTYPAKSGNPNGWVSPWHYGINQGPIIPMIENTARVYCGD